MKQKKYSSIKINYLSDVLIIFLFLCSQLMFYIVMGLENALLMFVWWVAVSVNPPWYRYKLPLLVMFLFFSGLVFMALYYRFFHVRRLKYESGGRMNTNSSNNSTARLQPGSSRCNDLSLGSKVSSTFSFHLSAVV